MDYNQKKPLFFRLIVYMSSLLTMTTQMMACRAKAEHLNVLAAAMDLEKAGKLQEKLTRDGIHAEVLREEPFTTARDSLDFQVFLMVWKKGWWNRRVEIRKL